MLRYGDSMILTDDQCYQAMLTHDRRFDGRFFVGVRSTLIYCRPICRVKVPQRKNCTFYTYAAQAEVAGYRPCKRCRPELAPGSSVMEISGEHARAALSLIQNDFLAEHSVRDLANQIGITCRHLRQVFAAEFGVSPIDYWQTHRLHLAKQLLTDTPLPITTIASASGYRSVRRFNSALKERYRMSPRDLRSARSLDKTESDLAVCFHLAYRPPFDWERLLSFLSRRAVPGVEEVRNSRYLRTVRVVRSGANFDGFIAVSNEPKQCSLRVQISADLIPVSSIIVERVKRIFDLEANPIAISDALGSLAANRPGLRVPGCFSGFEMAVRAILGQQISVAGATTLAGRVAAKFGIPLATPFESLCFLFPSAQQMARVDVNAITELGIIERRARTIVALADAIQSGEIHLTPGYLVETMIRRLCKIPGIGEWTAHYIAMRALSWPDAFPHSDLGIAKALVEKNRHKVLAIAEKWRPWRAYATLHLWAELESST